MSAIYCGRKWGLGPAGGLKEKGLAQAATEGMGRNKGAEVDVVKKSGRLLGRRFRICKIYSATRSLILYKKFLRCPQRLLYKIDQTITITGRSHWLCSLRRGFAVALLLGLQIRIPPGAWMSS